MSDRTLREAVAKGTDKIVGACTNKSTPPPIVESGRGRRKRKARVIEEAPSTGLTNAQRSTKLRTKKDKKRRKSFEANKRAEAILAAGKAKPGLVRQALAFVVGKENIVMPRQNGNKPQSKSTAARTRKLGGDLLNGAACPLDQQNPTTFRNAMVKQSITAKPTLAAKDHPFAAAAAETARKKAATKAAGKAAAEAAAAAAAAAQPPPPPTTTTTTTAAAQPTLAETEAAKDKAFVEKVISKDDATHKARLAMCSTFVDAVKEHVNPKDRRPCLACFACCTKPEAQQSLDMKPSEYEFHQAKIHAKCPGPLKPAPVVEQSKQRIPQATLQSFFRFLETPGNLQRYAFGAKMLDVAKGKSTVEIEAIDAMKKIESLAADCVQALDSELSVDQSTLPDSHERCQCLERSTHRRCMKERNHVGRCQFTPDGSLSRSTVVKLVKTLTGGEIKKLAGLDDAKALKGRDNFQLMRDIAESIVDDIGERNQIIKDIDDSEVFYQTDYIDHLQQKSNQKCCCLSCGFSREKEKLCSDNSSHDEACVECVRAYSVINKLERRLAAKVKESNNNGNVTIMQKQKLDEHNFELTQARKNLTQCRSHLARHKAEGDFHKRELQALDDDTAIVTCDWKMKLLACFFRENQAKHFGKKAVTSCIGFMVATKSTDEEVRKKGLMEVQFVMMLTDDTKQDEHNVACAKAEICRNHLPDHITKVIFRADGAGCFKSECHRCMQPHWKHWVGIEEIACSITPAGDGKSALDGMFGRMSSTLSSSVDSGNSYFDAASVKDAIEASGGLSATRFTQYKANRGLRLHASHAEQLDIQNVLRTELDPSDGALRAFEHSGCGCGDLIKPSQAYFSIKQKPNKKTVKANQDLLPSKPMDLLVPFAPKCDTVTHPSNEKEARKSHCAPDGESSNHPNQRRKRRENRIKSKAAALRNEEEETRSAKRNAGLFLCEARSPSDLHHCRMVHLTEQNGDEHVETGKHQFPKGLSSVDVATEMAANQGGIMAVGTHRDRLKKIDDTKRFPSAEVGSCGTSDANCFQQFHRANRADACRKPPRLIEALDNLFFHGADGPNLTPAQAGEELKRMIDPKDNGLMFCWSKRGIPKKHWDKAADCCPLCNKNPCDCNGMLPTEDQTQQYFSSKSAKEKKKIAGKAVAERGEKE